jgi:hypothetical protein
MAARSHQLASYAWPAQQSWDGAIAEFRNQLTKLKPSSEMVESARETLRKLKEAKLTLDNLLKEAVL